MFHVKHGTPTQNNALRSPASENVRRRWRSRRFNRPKTCTIWLSVGLALSLMLTQVCLSGDAEARRPKRKKRAQVSSALQELKWGESHNRVIKYLAKVITKRYKKVITKTLDGSKADRLRREMKREIKDLRKFYIEFSGQRTGYSVSFLKADFMHNNGETLLKFDEGSRTRYFFFRYDQLWKVVVSYPSDMGLSFEGFVGRVKKKYGRPMNQEWETPYGGSRQLAAVIWEDDKTILRLEDKSAFHGSYVMKLISRGTGDEIEKSHAAHHKATSRDLDAPQRIGDGIDIFGEEDNVEGIVDQITGTKHKVNLNRVQDVPPEQLEPLNEDDSSVVPK